MFAALSVVPWEEMLLAAANVLSVIVRVDDLDMVPPFRVDDEACNAWLSALAPPVSVGKLSNEAISGPDR